MDMDECIATYMKIFDNIFQKKYLWVNIKNGQIQEQFDTAELEWAIKVIIKN